MEDRIIPAWLNKELIKASPNVNRWLLPEANAEKWQMPDPYIHENQARLYAMLSYIGGVVDIIVSACIAADFDIVNVKTEKEIDNHELETLLNHPNEYDSQTEFLRAHYAWRMIAGNSYWYLNRKDKFSTPDEIWI